MTTSKKLRDCEIYRGLKLSIKEASLTTIQLHKNHLQNTKQRISSLKVLLIRSRIRCISTKSLHLPWQPLQPSMRLPRPARVVTSYNAKTMKRPFARSRVWLFSPSWATPTHWIALMYWMETKSAFLYYERPMWVANEVPIMTIQVLWILTEMQMFQF